jgi:hypothetical protein
LEEQALISRQRCIGPFSDPPDTPIDFVTKVFYLASSSVRQNQS